MLGIILAILKIIGVILLCILGLFYFLVLVILFVPVRYKAQGYYKDKSYQVKADVSYLLHIISVSVLFDGKLNLIIRLFGITLRKKNKAVKNKNYKKKVKINQRIDNELSTDEVMTQTSDSEKNDVAEVETANNNTSANSEEITVSGDSDNNAEASEVNNGSADNKKESKEKNNKDKKISALSNIKYYIDLLNKDSTKAAFAQCKKRIGLMLKSILPRKGRIYIRLGLNNAGIIGEILGYYRALYMYIGNVVKFVPVYTEKAFEGEFSLKGHIRPVVLLHHAICILLDKNCRKLIKIFLKKDRRK